MGLFSIFSRTVYFPGCSYFKFKEEHELYQKILSKLGINFKLMDATCSGLEPWEAGYEKETRKIVRDNFEKFKENKINSIIASNPGCYKMFLQNYPKYLPDWDIRVLNLWEIILEKLRNKPHLVRNKFECEITYHDSCYLGRYCGVYEEPREILKILGYSLKEMDNSRERSFCCGSCGGLPRVSPKLAARVAKERILQAKRIGAGKVVVVGLESYDLLKSNSQGLEVFELSKILGDALGIELREAEEDDLLENE